MSRLSITAEDTAKLFLPEAPRFPGTSSTALIAGALTPANYKKTIAAFQEAVADNFFGDGFSQDICRLAVLQCMRREYPAIFAASFGDDIESQARIFEQYESLDDLSKIESAADFALDVRPFADQASEFEAMERALKDNLRDNVDIRMHPLANLGSWLDAVTKFDDLAEAFKQPRVKGAKFDRVATLKQWIQANLPKGTAFDYENADAVESFYSFARTIVNVTTDKVRSGLNHRFEQLPTDDDSKAVNSAAGILEEVVPWLTIVNTLTASDARASSLVGFRSASQMSTTKVDALDFNLSYVENMPSETYDIPTQLANTDVLQTMAGDNWSASFDGSVSNATHLQALVYHIAAFADLDVSLPASESACRFTMYQPNYLVPLSLHTASLIVKPYLSDAWKAFLPEKRTLKSMEFIVNHVRGMRSTVIVTTKVRPDFVRVITEDLRSLITDIHSLQSSGRSIDVNEMIKKTDAKKIGYSQRLVTGFEDQSITLVTSIDDFVKSKSVSATCTRPLGIQQVPTVNSIGFSEAIVARDTRFLNAAIQSDSTSQIAQLFNNICDVANHTEYSLSQEMDVLKMFAVAQRDAMRGTKLMLPDSASNKTEALMASHFIHGAQFTSIKGDFYLLNRREVKTRLPLQAGQAWIDCETTQVGNIHGTITFGVISGNTGSFNTEFAVSIAELVNKVIDTTLATYCARQWICKKAEDSNVSFNEANDKYSVRLQDFDKKFSVAAIDAELLLTLAGSIQVDPTLRSCVDSDIVYSARRLAYYMRNDMGAILDGLVETMLTQLTTAHGNKVITLLRASHTRRLTIPELQEVQKRVFANSMKSASRDIAEIAVKLNPLTKTMFLSKLFAAMAAKELEEQALEA